ncbi:MMPL family transporter [Gordonia shandongensis]|uniref:MMPL family transporter n=1 Tax=Gordonia shandongensis TaxID=376351 RepID=UPI000424EA95|nr:MMPL family transporter [Gordonia shandongensis]
MGDARTRRAEIGAALRRLRPLERMARGALGHKTIVIAAWVLAAVALNTLLPQLETVVTRQSVQPIPADVPSFQALDAMGEAFDEPAAATTVFVVMSDPAGFDGAARHSYDELVADLRADREHVEGVRDLASDPIGAKQVVSEDGKAWYLPVGLVGSLGDSDADAALTDVREKAAAAFAGSDTEVHVTGPVATFADQMSSAESDLLVISVVTILVIGLILLIVYRSLITAMLPLAVIGLSLVVARGVLAGLGELGMPVSQYSISFLTAILLGAGTDYSVFVIGRYHELIRQGHDPASALVAATVTIGHVVTASAMTVALALLSMIFADLSVFATVGPASAIAIMIACLASLTILQPALAIAARYGRGLPKREITRDHWRRMGVRVVRRPVALLAGSLVLLIAMSVPLTGLRLSYDDRASQSQDTDGNLGYAQLDKHFPKDVVVAEFLLVTADHDLRTSTSLADLDQMAARVAQLPGVDRVLGVTRPTGDKLEPARLSWQNGQIANELGKAVTEGEGRSSELGLLKSGSRELADALAELHRRIGTDLAPLIGVLDDAADSVSAVSEYRPWLEKMAELGPRLDAAAPRVPEAAAAARRADDVLRGLGPVVDALDTPLCTGQPACRAALADLRSLRGLATDGVLAETADLADALTSGDVSVTGLSRDLTGVLATMDRSIARLGGMDLAEQFAELDDGIGQMADGARQLADGVGALVDSTVENLAGMGQVAAALRASSTNTEGSDAATGFYLPAETFENPDFAAVARQFISPDGRSVRYAVQTDVDPYSGEAIELSKQIAEVAQDARPNTELAGSRVAVAGFPAINADLQRLLTADFRLLAVATILIVGIILAVLLRSLVAPIYLVLTVIANYAASLGIGVLVFQNLLGQQMSWPVPLLAFIILVAVGADYNMLLVSRLREEAVHGRRTGAMRTVAHTGSVITSAGVIFAASMFGLMSGSVTLMVQAGFVIGVGLLLDTFVVRTLTVPAIAVLVGDAGWWPGTAVRSRRRTDSTIGA